jgi:hypothetical protein
MAAAIVVVEDLANVFPLFAEQFAARQPLTNIQWQTLSTRRPYCATHVQTALGPLNTDKPDCVLSLRARPQVGLACFVRVESPLSLRLLVYRRTCIGSHCYTCASWQGKTRPCTRAPPARACRFFVLFFLFFFFFSVSVSVSVFCSFFPFFLLCFHPTLFLVVGQADLTATRKSLACHSLYCAENWQGFFHLLCVSLPHLFYFSVGVQLKLSLRDSVFDKIKADVNTKAQDYCLQLPLTPTAAVAAASDVETSDPWLLCLARMQLEMGLHCQARSRLV